MKRFATSDELRLSFYCKDPDSTTKQDCATFYRTNHGTWVVQGDRLGPETETQLIGLAEHETYVEVPGRLMESMVRQYVKENHGVDLDGAA
ncbi:hypothetical protein SMC26_09620 [Actinomadura fulvescens]|uniref:Uncharacterized protein n=1 Tax=Actinomadura fulvescens TaxID=46160 RepID=A0ABP6CI76_9ACTN